MTPKQIELARHALGLDRRHTTSYRNRFVAGPGHDDYNDWMDLVATGLAEHWDASTIPFGGCDLFWLTKAGAELALKTHESLSIEDFPDARSANGTNPNP